MALACVCVIVGLPLPPHRGLCCCVDTTRITVLLRFTFETGGETGVKFELIDCVIEQDDDHIVAVKSVTKAEEYLQDHFPTFPVLPGVMMIETLVQAARMLLTDRANDRRLVLGEVRALRYGRFVKPGESLRVEVKFTGTDSNGHYKCKGVGYVFKPGQSEQEAKNSASAVSGRFTLRPMSKLGANCSGS